MPQVDNPKKAKLAQFAFGNGKKYTKSVLVGSREVRRKLARQAKKKAGGKKKKAVKKYSKGGMVSSCCCNMDRFSKQHN